MTTCVCLAAILLGTSVGPATAERSDRGPALLASSPEALMGVTGLRIVVTLPGVGPEALPIDVAQLQDAVAARLRGVGVTPVEDETALVPRLLVRMECTAVPDSDQRVCRVQVSLIRLVTLPERPEVRLEAEVWQGGRAVRVVTKEEAPGMLWADVLNQVQAFTDAGKLARSAPVPIAPGRAPSKPPTSQAASAGPFVCSKNSNVFHRSDCRLAQNIAADNRIGYKSRAAAVQAGKRPCKACKP